MCEAWTRTQGSPSSTDAGPVTSACNKAVSTFGPLKRSVSAVEEDRRYVFLGKANADTVLFHALGVIARGRLAVVDAILTRAEVDAEALEGVEAVLIGYVECRLLLVVQGGVALLFGRCRRLLVVEVLLGSMAVAVAVAGAIAISACHACVVRRLRHGATRCDGVLGAGGLELRLRRLAGGWLGLVKPGRPGLGGGRATPPGRARPAAALLLLLLLRVQPGWGRSAAPPLR